jgi:hypothetical protein
MRYKQNKKFILNKNANNFSNSNDCNSESLKSSLCERWPGLSKKVELNSRPQYKLCEEEKSLDKRLDDKGKVVSLYSYIWVIVQFRKASKHRIAQKVGFWLFWLQNPLSWILAQIIEISCAARHQDKNRSYNSVYYPMRMSRFEFFWSIFGRLSLHWIYTPPLGVIL